MDTTEIIVHVVQSDGYDVVLYLLGECIGERKRVSLNCAAFLRDGLPKRLATTGYPSGGSRSG